MTYAETLQYLYANLPMFQRVGATAYKKDLTNTLELCNTFDNPQQKLRFIHVAGTNGKGSVSHMLASILQSAGYKTGLYTSPHLKEFTERIKVNGEQVDQDFVVNFVERVRPEIERIKPSFFEITVVMALEYFAHKQVDIAVVEVGMGGRLDSTNVITPEVSVITNIGFDHMDFLGDTLQEIAFEKAGIIKEKMPVVISERQEEVRGVFETAAFAKGSPLFFAGDTYRVQRDDTTEAMVASASGQPVLGNITLPLQGNYQMKNLAGVLQTIHVLNQKDFSITNEQVLDGLKKVVVQTGLKGRWQKLGEQPLIICDTAHNADGIRLVIEQLQGITYNHLHMVIGMVKDKDRSAVLRLLPVDATYYFCQANIPRALDADVLKDEAESYGLMGEVIRNVNEAIDRAKTRAGKNDLIFIGGSTFVVAEIDNL